MKTFVKSSLIILAILTTTACNDDITSLNKNPQAFQAGSVPGDTFFANATRNLTDAMVYGMTFKVLAQQFSEATYFDASSYNLVNVGNSFWVSMYIGVLRDYKEAKTLITNEQTLYPIEQKNRLAIIEIMEVYTYSLLVNTYGDIPYAGALDPSLKSEALDSDNLTPAYDDAAAIYNDLFARLDAALEALDGSKASFVNADLFYEGDVASWVKFGNSLKLKMAVTLSDINPSLAATKAAEAAPFVFESNEDNAVLEYKDITPNTNPIWVGLIQSKRTDYVASNTMIEMMQSTAMDDPRIPLYYTADKDGNYTGGTYGKGNSYELFSHPGDAMTQKTTPGILFDYSEVKFYLAEAAARGFNVGGTAAEHYHDAIIASIEYWGGSTADAEAFIEDPAVAFATAPGTDIEKIAMQKYISLFNRGQEAWTEYRRFDYPKLKEPATKNGDFPIRYTYPSSEQTSNLANYTAAAEAIGGDVVTNRVFWDTK